MFLRDDFHVFVHYFHAEDARVMFQGKLRSCPWWELIADDCCSSLALGYCLTRVNFGESTVCIPLVDLVPEAGSRPH